MRECSGFSQPRPQIALDRHPVGGGPAVLRRIQAIKPGLP
jgi:hypothetical protein